MTLHEIYAGAWHSFMAGWLFGASFLDGDERPDDHDLSDRARRILRREFRDAAKACHIAAPLTDGDDLDRFGSDLALTLQGHGAGLWDGGWPQRGHVWTDAVQHLRMEGFVRLNRCGTLEIV